MRIIDGQIAWARPRPHIIGGDSDPITIFGRLGGYPHVTEKLLTLAQSEWLDELARQEAVAILGRLGRVDDLLMLVCDEKMDWSVWRKAAQVLGELGQVDDILALARDEKADWRIRERAAEALIELGRADEAAPLLLVLARDEKVDEWMRVRATDVVGELGRADEAAQVWLTLARDEKAGEWVRVCATAALGHFAGARVLPTLEYVAQEDKNKRVRRAAQWAIRQIRQRTGQDSSTRGAVNGFLERIERNLSPARHSNPFNPLPESVDSLLPQTCPPEVKHTQMGFVL